MNTKSSSFKKIKILLMTFIFSTFMAATLNSCSKDVGSVPNIVFSCPPKSDGSICTAPNCQCDGGVNEDDGITDTVADAAENIASSANNLQLATAEKDASQESNTLKNGESLALTADPGPPGIAGNLPANNDDDPGLLDQIADRISRIGRGGAGGGSNSSGKSSDGSKSSNSGLITQLGKSQETETSTDARAAEGIASGGFTSGGTGQASAGSEEKRAAIDANTLSSKEDDLSQGKNSVLSNIMRGGAGKKDNGNESSVFAGAMAQTEAGENIASSEDPVDYFTLISTHANIFERVERRYREKSMVWAKEDARSLR